MQTRDDFMMRCWNVIAGAMLCGALAAMGCGPQGDGLVKYPVRGAVMVNGKPAEGVVVRFSHVDSKLPGTNARFPVGVTDQNGDFQLATNGEKDGAVEGEYQVGFLWPERPDPPPGDLFGGAYANPASTGIKVTIEPRENVLETFELTTRETTTSSRRHEEE